MSLDACKNCSAIVDTDEQPECYDTGRCLCERCRERCKDTEEMFK